MLYSERSESFDSFTPEQKALLPHAIERWRVFVQGDADKPGIHELHFLPMGVVADYEGDRTLPANMNRYTLRTIELHVAASTNMAFAFVKMGPAVALGFIQPPPPDTWIGTRVALGDGQVGGKMGIPVAFLDYFIERARRLHASERLRSADSGTRSRRGSWPIQSIPARRKPSELRRLTLSDLASIGRSRLRTTLMRGQ